MCERFQIATETWKVTQTEVGQAPLNPVQTGRNVAVNRGSQQEVIINITVVNRNVPLT